MRRPGNRHVTGRGGRSEGRLTVSVVTRRVGNTQGWLPSQGKSVTPVGPA